MIAAKEYTCLIRLACIISSELRLRCSNEEPILERILEEAGPQQGLTETEESDSHFGYAYRVFDNEDILLELDGSNNIVARYTHGPGIDEPLVVEKAGASFFYHADGLGSITEITDNAGVVVQRYTYSSFGKIESQLDPTFVQPYTFTAREFDPETDLYFYRARTYDPASGRFLQEDPILRAGDPTSPDLTPLLVAQPALLNPYPYVVNNPLKFRDQTGEGPILLAACVIGEAANLISTIRALNELERELTAIKEQST